MYYETPNYPEYITAKREQTKLTDYFQEEEEEEKTYDEENHL